ncbi:hypothetical protein GCM10022280_01800 [Sphingomonas swuensis]|uniref:YbhB/YbcL family Raf kinase inhibitor-like protein n=1 Tax=Sphingomonas swuensis TaxID=977800 RepID=A0ABP7S9N4_9SPHN
MLEKLPHWLGAALRPLRAGHEGLTICKVEHDGAGLLTLSSPAFAPGGRLPPRFTADGEGLSPPLFWSGVPEGADSLVLVVEDADAPAPRPLVHALVVGIDASATSLAEGAIVADGKGAEGRNVGRNSYLAEGWLPPDPPTGHGAHDYVFQLFAIAPAGDAAIDEAKPGRGDVRDLLAGRILASGLLIGTYSRGEEAPVEGGSGMAAPAPTS